MKLSVSYQDSYSRGELLLRTLFGAFYIVLPHMFLLFFVSLWSSILGFIAFWVVLFTGKYPKSMFEFQVGVLRWSLRLESRMYNIADGYPAFGINAEDEHTSLDVEYPEKLSRGLLLVRLFFAYFYVLIPHGFLLVFRSIWVSILVFLSWWIVLFTGKYPQSFFEWVVGQLRWETRVNLYLSFMTDTYPPFTGKELAEEA